MKNLAYILLFLLSFQIPVFAEDTDSFQLNATATKNIILGKVYVYNLSNGKLHTPDCEWALKCTKNCIYINKRDLKKMFFIPCTVCGGGVVEPADEYLNESEE